MQGGKSMKSSFVYTVALFAGVMLLSGCAKLTLSHKPLAPVAAIKAPVQVVVNNARPPEFGAGNPKLVGNQRNLYGMRLDFESENDAMIALRDMFANALFAAGVPASPAGGVQVVVDIKTFWFDGYMGYKAEIVADIKVVNAGQISYQKEYKQAQGFKVMSKGDIQEGFDQFMVRIQGDLVPMLQSPEFLAAVP